MRPTSRAPHGDLKAAAGISPTYVDQPRAITRTGRDRRVQPDLNFRRQFFVFSHVTNLSHPYRSCTTLLPPRFATVFSLSRSSLPRCNAHSWGDFSAPRF